MTDPQISGFQSRTVEVSDEEKLSVQLLDDDASGLPDKMEIKIKQLYSVQINKGRELLYSSKGLAPGVYEFRARMGSKTYNLIFYQESRRNNQTVLKEMADLLNYSIPGIKAAVENGNARDYYRITITADLPDEAGASLMVFEDSENTQFGIVDYLGMNRVERMPLPAEIELDGVTRQAAGNRFKLNDRLLITLKETTDEPVYINLVPDSTKILKSVQAALDTYNSMINTAKKHMEAGSNFGAGKLIAELKTLADIYSEELSACGIAVTDDGSLILDETVSAFAARIGKMESLFTRNNGFMAKLRQKAEAIAANPMEYIDKTLVTYIDVKKTNYRYPYITSLYSGLFYNTIC